MEYTRLFLLEFLQSRATTCVISRHFAVPVCTKCRATHLSDLFDLAAPLADQRATLTGGNDDAQGDRGLAGGRAVGHRAADVLDTHTHTHTSTALHNRQHYDCVIRRCICSNVCRSVHTSSSFSIIIENALKMAVVGPARVMILSGQFPSEMLILAPLYRTPPQKTFFRNNYLL